MDICTVNSSSLFYRACCEPLACAESNGEEKRRKQNVQNTFCKSSNFVWVNRKSHAMRSLCHGTVTTIASTLWPWLFIFIFLLKVILLCTHRTIPSHSIVFIDANKFGILQPNHQSILSDMIPGACCMSKHQNNVCIKFDATIFQINFTCCCIRATTKKIERHILCLLYMHT